MKGRGRPDREPFDERCTPTPGMRPTPLICILLLAATASACRSGVSHSRGGGDVSQRLQLDPLLAGLDVTLHEREAPGTPRFVLRGFDYKGPQRARYGSGFGVFDRSSGQLLWIHLIPGDYSPHSWQWEDFDGDGRRDIFFLAGSEDVFETHIIFDRVASDRFALTNFYAGVRVDDAYAFVVEAPDELVPDLLLPLAPRPEMEFESRCLDSERGDELRRDVVIEARRIAGRFGHFAFSPDHPDIFLFERVRFVNVRDGWWADVTQRHRDHLRWRLATLRDIREEVDATCQQELDAVIAHLEKLLQSVPTR